MTLYKIPETDIDGFVEWVKNGYTKDRWSRVYKRDDTVTVWSGKYPAFHRFQADLRPHLHEHGLVIADTRTNVPREVDGGREKIHWVKAEPIRYAIEEMAGVTQYHGSI